MEDEVEGISVYEYEALSEERQVLRQNILGRIDGIEAIGSFATGNSLDSCPIPGISVDGGKTIALPLSEEAAHGLASQSDKAPSGKGRETQVDETAGKTLQISAERITFRNPQWDGFVPKLVKRVAQELYPRGLILLHQAGGESPLAALCVDST